MERLLDSAINSGIFALLFIVSSSTFLLYIKKMVEDMINKNTEKEKYIQELIININNKNDERENLYIETINKNQEIIRNLSDALKCIDDISDDIKNIKQCILERKR